jgi:hypothetical protein
VVIPAVQRGVYAQSSQGIPDYMSKVDAISYEGLYTPQSYLDAREARRIIAQLEAVLEMEKSQERALDDIAERYKTKIESLDRSEEYKRKFLKGFDEGLDEVKTAIRKIGIDNCARESGFDRKNVIRKLVRGIPVKRNSHDEFVRWLQTRNPLEN